MKGMRKLLIFILAAACSTGIQAREIKGSVKDTDGKGISGVVVSDGLNTVSTDAKGRFKMEADDDSRFVFISTPSGYISSTLEGGTLFYKELNDKTKRRLHPNGWKQRKNVCMWNNSIRLKSYRSCKTSNSIFNDSRLFKI